MDKQPVVRLPEDSDLSDNAVFGEHHHVAAFLVYVDDFLAAGPRFVLQPLLKFQLLQLWKRSSPDFLGHDEGDVDSLRFLGLGFELGCENGAWSVHQQSYVYVFLKEAYDFVCLKECKTPAESQTVSTHPEAHANKAKPKGPKHAVLECSSMDFLRTHAVARVTRLATSDEAQARVCIRHVLPILAMNTTLCLAMSL